MKSIKIRLSVYYNGAETQIVDLSDSGWDYQRSLEPVCLLQKKSNTCSKAITLDVDMKNYYRIKGDRTND